MNITAEEVSRVVTDVCDQALRIYPSATEGGDVPAMVGRQLAAMVHITGEWHGAISIHCTDGLAARAAGAMFDMNPAAVSSRDEIDALGELVNMIGGNLKPLVPGPSYLSLPTVINGSDFLTSLLGSRELSRYVFDCEGQPLVVRIFECRAQSPRNERLVASAAHD